MASPTGGPKEIDPVRAAESNTATLISVLTIFHGIALVFVALRVYARAFIIKTFGRDDVCMVLSAICALGGWVVFIIQAQHGLGKHQETISQDDLIIFQHAGFWQSIISATWALGFLKVSIGFNLLRLSTSKWYSWSLWATIVIVCCYTFMGMMTFLLYCQPMEGYWNPAVKPNCYPIPLFVTFALVNTGFNITTDVLFASFPVPIIWTLKMKRKLKLYLIAILSLGYFALIMGIVKSVYQIAFARMPDKTFNQSIQFWGFLQLNIGIIAACATSLKPLFNRVLKLSTTDHYNTPARYGYGYGSRSRGTKLNGAGANDSHTGTGQRSVFRGPADEYELEDGIKTSGEENLSAGKAVTYSTATSFYKHGSPAGSGSEEMILGTPGHGAAIQMPPHALTTDEATRGIVRTTEVRVTVK
ncbi:hypothetical protein C8A00DRAFT_13028 [Chaetomidium leptoderma]|uniref:Rhodopsin domain-containing protein n=1 Tax=Chaetomidium leptoderma TaxID=669021 RepID=A0AAN6VQM4_9PEZI|nr:hypothetical protein C8A00DRAFT_13028 [Chaetomidium leptoderma]